MPHSPARSDEVAERRAVAPFGRRGVVGDQAVAGVEHLGQDGQLGPGLVGLAEQGVGPVEVGGDVASGSEAIWIAAAAIFTAGHSSRWRWSLEVVRPTRPCSARARAPSGPFSDDRTP